LSYSYISKTDKTPKTAYTEVETATAR